MQAMGAPTTFTKVKLTLISLYIQTVHSTHIRVFFNSCTYVLASALGNSYGNYTNSIVIAALEHKQIPQLNTTNMI